jgi:hypothetical protein
VSEPHAKESAGAWTGLAGVGVLALAIGCCGALPLGVALAGSVAVGTIVGVGAGALVPLALLALIMLGVRRRRACETSKPRSVAGE